MTRPQQSTDDEIAAWLADHPAWERNGGQIERQITFADFTAAFAFMTRMAFVAEKLDHHPEWCNVYSRVDIVLTTHDAAGITSLDFEFAEAVDAVLQERS